MKKTYQIVYSVDSSNMSLYLLIIKFYDCRAWHFENNVEILAQIKNLGIHMSNSANV